MTNDNNVRDEEVTPVCPKRKYKKSTSDNGGAPLVKKQRKSKIMNKKECDSLKALIISLNPSIFHGVIADKFKAKQTLSEKLKQLASSLLENDKLLNDIVLFHCHCLAALYTECKKGADPFIRFQFHWYNHCSAFLLSRQHSVAEIELEELPSAPINITRSSWLSFCEASGVPVPQCKPVMMLVSCCKYNLIINTPGIKNGQPRTKQALLKKM